MSNEFNLRLPAGLSITFLGQSGFKIVTEGGKTVLMDPWLTDNPVLPEDQKIQNHADLVMVTHGHGDHLDKNIAGLLSRTDAHIVAPSDVLTYVETLNIKNRLFINKGGTIEFEGLKITMTNALHFSSIRLPDGTSGYPHEATGLILTTESGFKIYHAGDTGIFSEMALIGEIYKPDLALLPIGDRATMGPLEASYAVRLLGVKQVIPHHYATFPMLTGTAEAFVEEIGKRGLTGINVAALKPGDKVSG